MVFISEEGHRANRKSQLTNGDMEDQPGFDSKHRVYQLEWGCLQLFNRWHRRIRNAWNSEARAFIRDFSR